MVKLRLFRMGCHKNPSYRIVVSDSKAKANGEYIEQIGIYDPKTGTYKLNEYLSIKWLYNGAQPSDTVKSLLSDEGIWKKYKLLKDKKEVLKYLEENKPIIVKKEQTKKVVKKVVEKTDKVETKQPVKKPEPDQVKKVVEKTDKVETKQPVKKPEPDQVKKVVEKTDKVETKEPVKKQEQNETKQVKKDSKELKVNKESKLFSKVSEEEILKRQSQKFEVSSSSSTSHNEPVSDVIMISLDKDQIENIVNNEKEIIYLKRLPAHNFSRVLIYSKKPIGMVIGEFDVKEYQVLKKTPAWKNYGSKSIFNKKEFDEYFEDQDDAKLIEIKEFILYNNPRNLSDFKLSKGPSGFTYLK